MLDWMKTILAGNVLVQSLVYLMGGRKLMQMLPITHILYAVSYTHLVSGVTFCGKFLLGLSAGNVFSGSGHHHVKGSR